MTQLYGIAQVRTEGVGVLADLYRHVHANVSSSAGAAAAVVTAPGITGTATASTATTRPEREPECLAGLVGGGG